MEIPGLLNFFNENDLKAFKGQDISPHNIEIAVRYLRQIKREELAGSTLTNNINFMRLMLFNVSYEFDQMDEADRDDIIDIINDRKKKNGKPIAASTKKQYKISLKRFLNNYGEITHNKEMVELARFKVTGAAPKQKLVDDILTEEEIIKIINAAPGIRNKAIVATLFESGARVGELINCRVKDVKPFVIEASHGYHLILDGKTGARQVMIFKYQQWLRSWLNDHPNVNEPEAPLFTTTRQYGVNSYNVDKSKRGQDEIRTNVQLNGRLINRMLKRAAKKANIKKNVHPHLLRHSQATRLANTMTEQQLKKQFGWKPGSNMPGIYCHLAGKDTDDAMLASYGVITKRDQNGNTVDYCVQCGEVLAPGMKFCGKCGLPTDRDYKQSNEMDVNTAIAIIMKYQEEQGKMLYSFKK